MRPKLKSPLSIGELLTTSKRLNLKQNIPLWKLGEKWESIVGINVAVHSHPLKLYRKVLTILVDHPTWMQELTYLKPMLIEKIKANAGSPLVENIRFEIGEIPAKIAKRNAQSLKKRESLKDDEVEFIDIAAGEIPDTEVSAAAKHAMEAYFKTERK